MNRHLRNLGFFLLGFLSMLLAGYASAGWAVNDGYNSSGGNLNRAANGNAGAGSSATASVSGDTVNVNRSWTQAVGDAAGSSAAAVAINVLSKIPKSGVVNAARSLTLPGLAMTVATTWLLNQNWTRDSAGNWLKPNDDANFPGTYTQATANCVKLTKSQMDSCFSNYLHTDAYLKNHSCSIGSWQSYNSSTVKINYSCDYGGNYAYANIVTPNAGSTAPATDADILAQMDSLVNAQTKQVLDALAQQKTDLQNATNQIQQLADALSPKTTLETGTQINPDGSTQATSKQSQQKYEISGDVLPAESPVPVKQSTVITTTTNVYNTDNSVKTTTNTTTTPKSVTDQQQQKTDCDKLPNSVGCADLGTAPGAVDMAQQTVNPTFSWSPFSLPSQCPAPMTIATSHGSYSMSWQPECDFATKTAPLVIAFAGLAALYIAFGMKNDG